MAATTTTSCKEDTTFTYLLVNPDITQEQLDAFIVKVNPSEKDAAVWQRIAESAAQIAVQQGRPFTPDQVVQFVSMVGEQCIKVKGV